jgi:hypothetical protein
MNMHIAVDLLLKMVFSLWSVLRCYEQNSFKNSGQFSVERSSVLAALKKGVSCKSTAVTSRPEHVKLKNLHC